MGRKSLLLKCYCDKLHNLKIVYPNEKFDDLFDTNKKFGRLP
jgi:hypothetical protein